MNYHYFCMFLVLFATTNVAYSQEEESGARAGEIALSDEALQLRHLSTANRFSPEGSETSAGVFLSEDRDIVLSAGMLFKSQPLSWRRLRVSVGGRAYAALLGQEDTDIVAFAAGAQIRYVLFPSRSVNIIAYGYYAPDILTFGSADNVRDLGVKIQAPLTERLIGFVGIRDYDIELLDNSTELESSLIVGVRYEL